MEARETQVRFYQWCLRDAMSELDAGFPFVILFSTFGARGFLHLIHDLTGQEQREFLRALVRRRHEGALKLMGEGLSDTDTRWISYLMQERTLPPLEVRPALPGKLPQPMITAKVLTKALQSSDGLSMLAAKISRFGTGIWIDYRHSGFTIRTAIDVGGKSRQVSFNHTLLDSSESRVLDSENPLRWMGVGGCQWIHVSLTPRFMKMVRQRVESGRYQSASEVVRDGLRLLEERDREQEAFWAEVRDKVAEAQAQMRAGKGIPGDVARAQMEAMMRRNHTQKRAAKPRNGEA